MIRACPTAIPGEAGTPFMTVSYTHLRAHETVLDLVCRLLLEKKKQKRNATHDEPDDHELLIGATVLQLNKEVR